MREVLHRIVVLLYLKYDMLMVSRVATHCYVAALIGAPLHVRMLCMSVDLIV